MAPGRQESENSSIVDQHAGRRGRKRRASGGSDERPPVPVSEIPRLGAQTPSRAYRRWSEQLQEVGAARTKPGKTGGVVPKVTKAESWRAESWRPMGQELENSTLVDQRAGRRGRNRPASGRGDERPPVPVSEIPQLGAQEPCRAPRRWLERLQEAGTTRTKPGRTGGVVPKVTRQNQGPPVIAEKTCDRGAPASSRRTFGGCAIKTSRGGRGQNAAPGLKIDQ